ncbi:MAG: Hpt domain-containing protein [Calditrichia bacterium]
MNIDSVLDRQELYSRVDDDMELLQELIELFLEDYPQLMSEINESIQSENADGLKAAAHTLKGSVSNFCAQKAVDAALKLEISGSKQDFTSGVADFHTLKEAMDEVSQALEELSKECVV